ncbi:Cutinase transcription factor 1 beta [Hirsutella minnesotensis 3608]|uniref:Cutinase transcription factor 1 beta n=1 Tax=Hirsutella minnesotensis 3608 TaxID=1043627 RepID=A0A0F7ZNR9_9HYPO|nr:Cutinase transcription factor 1 beta [Hirsutella minnesotensis 3608]
MTTEAALEAAAIGASPTIFAGDKLNGTKRAAATGDGPDAPPHKVTKRRAARACVSCRARKVRCDVVEGAPCGNCRWDNVECIVQESRRRKKNLVTASATTSGAAEAQQQLRCRATSSSTVANTTANLNPSTTGCSENNGRGSSSSSISSVSSVASNNVRRSSNGGPALSAANATTAGDSNGHVPHMIYQRTVGYRPDQGLLSRPAAADNTTASPQFPWNPSLNNHADLFDAGRTAQFLSSLELPDAGAQLPAFVRPLPSKVAPEDVRYLYTKGALTLPGLALQNALLQAYVEYVYPYMPLMDLHDFLGVISRRDGVNGQTSLFLYQAVMFSATAFVEMKYLREAGYASRKAARKAFFQKTRLLYDFDYESDRLVLVQGLMHMTYWYETPDDQKDTWHWMGVAISLAHTIGLHRNPETTSMTVTKQRLWKRIWWSCFMRDRLIALGMRRPTRIKDEDFDVPMLVESDFEIQTLAESNTVIPAECTLMRDVAMQRELATLCIAKAKLCICISHMLTAQYSVLIRDKMRPENTTNSTMMLFPNKQPENVEGLGAIDLELCAWAESLPANCRYRPLNPLDVKDGRATIAVQRTLLHMVFHTTVSALHRPQFLPASPLQAPTASRQAQEMSRLRVRDAASQITRMATQLHHLRLERFLPTTGVTVILPAMIIHLLEMKNPIPQERERATRGFRQCMRVMEKLREIYAAADYASGFLDAALRKAAIDINAGQSPLAMVKQTPTDFRAQTPPPDNVPYMTASETLFSEKPKPPVKQTMMPPNTVNAAALELSSANSPPHTDFDSAGVTPSASGGSDVVAAEMDTLDLDFMQGHDEFDWNAVAGTDFDVDQWLQFPPEGANMCDEEENKAMEQVLNLDQLADDGEALMPTEASFPQPDTEISL